MADPQSRLERLKAVIQAPPEEAFPIWMTVYSDMMTNLMLFFLMMFAFNLVGENYSKKAAEAFKKTIQGDQAAPAESAPAQDLDEFFRRLARTDAVEVIRQEGEGVRLRLPEPVLFDLGSAELKPQAGAVLHEIAAGLKNLPNLIVVEGHTDDLPVVRGPYKSNWELSEARAENVVDYLVAREGLPAKRLAVAGYGEYWPFTSNDSDLNRALNRRIELLVINDEKKPA